MGACCSCLETVLENESNVKIHVIEPTTVVMGEPSMVITSSDIARLPSAHGGRPSSSPLPSGKNASTTITTTTTTSTATIILPRQSASASAGSISTATAKPYGGPMKGQLNGGPMILSPYSVGSNGLMRSPQMRTNSARRLAVPQQNANFLHPAARGTAYLLPTRPNYNPMLNGPSATESKERGNKLFQAGRFEEALTAYTHAIIKNNTDPSYFTNRALCNLNLKKWEQVGDDCRKALELDKKNIKANYFLGKTCIQLGQYDEAIKALTRANECALNQKLSFGDEITQMLRMARREKFRLEEEKRITQEIELQSYLNTLIDEDVARRVADIQQNSEDRSEEAIEDKIDLLRNEGATNKDRLNNLFAQVDERRRKREIPDYLCGKISFELLRDPVITPSGITYDRADIKEHLRRVGHFDPITRVPLTVNQLIPNLAMKEVLDSFVAENEWALDE